MNANRDRAHPYFGSLRYDAALNWWQGTVPGTDAIRVHMSLDECVDEGALLSMSELVCRDLSAWRKRIEDFAVRELLPLKNETWLAEGEAEVSSDDFRRRMTLESITLYPDGAFAFTHGDGELFWGHLIQVCGTVVDGPTDADIPG